MVIITGTIRVESEPELAKVRDALVRRAQRSRNDAGNIEYTFSQSLEDPTEIRLIEKWESEASLQAHLQLPDEEFDGVLQNTKMTAAVVEYCEATNERVLMQRP